MKYPTGLSLVQATESHKNFILATHWRSCAKNMRDHGLVPMPVRTSATQEAIVSNTKVLTSDGNTVFAWVCGAPGKLFYVYVVPEVRLRGVGSALISEVCLSPELSPDEHRQYAYQCKALRTVLDGWTFNPYLTLHD